MALQLVASQAAAASAAAAGWAASPDVHVQTAAATALSRASDGDLNWSLTARIRWVVRPAAPPAPAELPIDTMQYKGCTLEYWPKCMDRISAIAFCRGRGGGVYSYMDAADFASFNTFASRQSAATGQASVTCAGLQAYYPGVNNMVWTGLRPKGGGNNCGLSCVWQDNRTGNVVTNINSISPCSMDGTGNGIQVARHTPAAPPHAFASCRRGSLLLNGSMDPLYHATFYLEPPSRRGPRPAWRQQRHAAPLACAVGAAQLWTALICNERRGRLDD
jgi:hypothetical protein